MSLILQVYREDTAKLSDVRGIQDLRLQGRSEYIAALTAERGGAGSDFGRQLYRGILREPADRSEESVLCHKLSGIRDAALCRGRFIDALQSTAHLNSFGEFEKYGYSDIEEQFHLHVFDPEITHSEGYSAFIKTDLFGEHVETVLTPAERRVEYLSVYSYKDLRKTWKYLFKDPTAQMIQQRLFEDGRKRIPREFGETEEYKNGLEYFRLCLSLLFGIHYSLSDENKDYIKWLFNNVPPAEMSGIGVRLERNLAKYDPLSTIELLRAGLLSTFPNYGFDFGKEVPFWDQLRFAKPIAYVARLAGTAEAKEAAHDALRSVFEAGHGISYFDLEHSVLDNYFINAASLLGGRECVDLLVRLRTFIGNLNAGSVIEYSFSGVDISNGDFQAAIPRFFDD
jgi:hypothetical protein